VRGRVWEGGLRPGSGIVNRDLAAMSQMIQAKTTSQWSARELFKLAARKICLSKRSSCCASFYHLVHSLPFPSADSDFTILVEEIFIVKNI
jgi:hypothetical protein